MSKKWGVTFILVGILFIAFPWIVPLAENLFRYLALFPSFIFHYKLTLERIFPASLILLGLAVLSRGYLRRALLLLAIAVALISVTAMILPSGFLFDFPSSVSENKIEFFAGDMIVVWEGQRGAEGLEVVKVKGNSLSVEFFAGQVKVFLPNKDVSVSIKGGVGEIRVFAPEDVKVEVNGNLGIGDFKNTHVPINPKHTAKIRYELGVGEVRVE